MFLRIIYSFAAIVIFEMCSIGMGAQQIDPSVTPMDPSVNLRVQDPDQPQSALLPGGSNTWTGQPIMSQTSSPKQQSGSNIVSQYPSLAGAASTWGGLSSLTVGSSDSGTPSGTPGQQSLLSSPKTKMTLARKLKIMALNSEVQASDRSARMEEALAIEQNLPASAAAKYIQLRRATAKSARVRVKNPFQSKADVTATVRWGADRSSEYALEQRQHESGMLLHSGFNARTERKRRHKKHQASTLASR